MVRLITKYKAEFSELKEAEIINETDKAYLVKYIEQEQWIAKKFVKIRSEDKRIFYVDWFIERHFV